MKNFSVFLFCLFLCGCSVDKPAKHGGSGGGYNVTEKESYIYSASPVELGRYYLDNVYRIEKKPLVYNTLSDASKTLIEYADFNRSVDALSKKIAKVDQRVETVTIDTLFINEENLLAYYMIVFEKNIPESYFIIELFFSKESGKWKVDLTRQEGEFSIFPVYKHGYADKVDRQKLEMIQDEISVRMKSFKEDSGEYEAKQTSIKESGKEGQETSQQQSTEDINQDFDTEKIVKKEMVIGKVYFDVENYEKARESFEKVIEIDPENFEAQDYLIKSLNALKEKDKKTNLTEGIKPESVTAQPQAINLVPSVTEKPVMDKEPIVVNESDKIKVQPEKKSVEDELFDNCLALGKKFYDEGKYRKAMVQFQKALGFKPHDNSIKAYIAKCEKAIQLSPSSN